MIPIRGSLRGRYVPVVTILLLIANVLVFLGESWLSPLAPEVFVRAWGFVPARDLAGGSIGVALVAALTSMFVHGGWVHLVGNMLYLWVFGSGLESRIGATRFGALYVIAGIAAALAQGWVDPLSTAPMVGASGAIGGALGAYFVVSPRARLTVIFPIWIVPLFFEIPAVVFLGLWFVQQFLSGFLSLAAAASGGIAWWAHVAGFLVGALLVRAFGLPPPPESPVTRGPPRFARDPW